METKEMNPVRYRQGVKPLHEYLRTHAAAQPEKPAFIWYGNALSYGELDRLSDAFAAKLHDLSVTKGDRVALFLQNCPQYVIAHFGIQKIGAIVSPCSPLFKEHELEYQLADLATEVIVAADNLYPIVEAVQTKTAVRHVFLTSYADFLPAQPNVVVPGEICTAKRHIPGTIDFFDSLEQVNQAALRPDLSMDDVALMTYTSGTTGLPKGAMLSYGNALFKTFGAADCNEIKADEVLLAVAPLYHIAGMLVGINATIYTGVSTVLLYRFDPLAVLQAIDRYNITHWYSIAPMNVAVMNTPGADQFDLSTLRTNPATSFGITMTEALANQWRQFTGHCQTFEAAYGLSETHTFDSYMPREAVKWGTHGKLMPEVECRIVDVETGKVQPPGEMGEIALRSPGTFKGYWNKPQATVDILRDGWLYTGDMGKMDAEGYLTFCGRLKEMIKVSGYSVFPEEVETLLIKHPAVQQAAVIGIPDPSKGQVVKAVLVLKPQAKNSVSADEIIAWSRENMSAYKVPRAVEFRDALPATGTGKMLRRLLKD
jgi:long-chain acyl-CoA synthetase